MLRRVTEPDLSTTVLGIPSAPVLTAPVGALGLVHPDADGAVTRAAAALGPTSVLSTLSSTSLEDVAAAAPQAQLWFQLYWPRDAELAESLVGRAERVGYRGLDHSADAVVVSNHGGRQVDGARAVLDCLPDVVAAIAGRVPVLFDSGVRCGADVLIALTLGASPCCSDGPGCMGWAWPANAGWNTCCAPSSAISASPWPGRLRPSSGTRHPVLDQRD